MNSDWLVNHGERILCKFPEDFRILTKWLRNEGHYISLQVAAQDYSRSLEVAYTITWRRQAIEIK